MHTTVDFTTTRSSPCPRQKNVGQKISTQGKDGKRRGASLRGGAKGRVLNSRTPDGPVPRRWESGSETLRRFKTGRSGSVHPMVRLVRYRLPRSTASRIADRLVSSPLSYSCSILRPARVPKPIGTRTKITTLRCPRQQISRATATGESGSEEKGRAGRRRSSSVLLISWRSQPKAAPTPPARA